MVIDASWQIDHPFVVNMRYAFQDDENCFFVLDLMLGGDLRCTSPISPRDACTHLPTLLSPVHLERLGHLSEEAVKFFVAQIASALAFIHDKRIIHRYVPFSFPISSSSVP